MEQLSAARPAGRLATLGCVIGLLCGCAEEPGSAHVIPDEPSCSECRIDVEVVAEFGHELDDGMIGSPFPVVSSLRDGRWLALDGAEPGVFRFYSPEGRYESRLDLFGPGPGEFTGLSDLLAVDEGYLAYDVTLSRLTWLDSSFRFLRSMQVAGNAGRIALLPDESAVVLTHLSVADSGRTNVLQLHRFDGTPPVAFGGPGASPDLRADPRATSRVIAVDREGAIWSGRISQYEFVKLSVYGDTLATLRRTGSVFGEGPYSPTPFDAGDPAPSPRVHRLFLDADGLLWVVFIVAGEGWEAAVRDRPVEGVPDPQGVWDSMVEVIDPRSGRLLARRRLPHYLGAVRTISDSGRVMVQYVAERSDGTLSVQVLELTLARD